MDYLIGNIDTIVIKELLSNDNFDTTKDTITFYSDSVKDVCLCFTNDINLTSFTIRGYFQDSSNADIELCKKHRIKLSLIIEEFTTKKMNSILTLIDNSIKFDCVISDKLLDDHGTRKYIANIIKEKNILIRIMQKSSSNKFFNILRLLQEELFECGSNQLLYILDNRVPTNNEIECRIIAPNKNVLKLFENVIVFDGVTLDYQLKIDSQNTAYYLLDSVNCYSHNGLSYLKSIAVNKLQNRMMMNRSGNQSLNDNNEVYDVIFVYANRFRSTVSVPFPPIGLYYLNSLAQSNGFKSKVIECTENSFLENFKTFVGKTKVVGFYCACNNEVLVTNIISHIKKNSDIKVIVGGPQTPVLDERFFARSLADVAVIGEGEGALIDLLNFYIHDIGKLSDIGNLKYLEKNSLCVTPQREIINNLDLYPYAKLKRSDISKYNSMHRIFILTGRGCPNRCTFCYEGANARKVRYRSMKCVFDEINYLLNEFPMANVLHVLDDTFTCDQKRVFEFCDNMRKIRESRKIDWVCEVHVGNIWNKPELLEYMLDSGMRGFQIGLESGSDMVLKSYKKNTTSKMIRSFIDTCAMLQRNFFIEGNIILGGPFESIETINESLDICKYLITKGRGIVELNTLCFSPLPNTDITNHPEKYGLHIHWDEVDSSILAMSSVVTSSEFLTKEDIEAEKRRIDKDIEEKYIYETLRLKPNQVMNFWNKSINQFMIGSRWGAILNRYEHFNNYALSIAFDNARSIEYSPYIFPIRTFEKIDYLNQNFTQYDIAFSNTEKQILKMCTGKYNILEIGTKMCVSLEKLEEILNSLRQKCLVYYSLY